MDDQYVASDYDASSDEPFIGGVDSVVDDTNNQYDETSYINSNSSFTPLQLEKSPKKRRGRPPKAEHEKVFTYIILFIHFYVHIYVCEYF